MFLFRLVWFFRHTPSLLEEGGRAAKGSSIWWSNLVGSVLVVGSGDLI
jgi:hypothetical protein